MAVRHSTAGMYHRTGTRRGLLPVHERFSVGEKTRRIWRKHYRYDDWHSVLTPIQAVVDMKHLDYPHVSAIRMVRRVFEHMTHGSRTRYLNPVVGSRSDRRKLPMTQSV